jgi:hypothetical protein
MTFSTPNRETQPNRREKRDAGPNSFRHRTETLFAGDSIRRSERRRRRGGGRPHFAWLPGRHSTQAEGSRGGLNQMFLAVIAAAALAFVPQAGFAQHGGGGHGVGGGHFGGGSFGSSHTYAPASRTHSGGSPSGAAVRPGTPPVNFVHGNPTVISHGVSPSSFARPTGPAMGFVAGAAAPVPQRVTIGFPPPGGAAGWRPIAPIHDGGVLSFSGQGHDIWQNNSDAGDMRPGSSSALLESRPAEAQGPHPFPPRRFHGGFFGPGYGYGYGYGFGGFYPWSFGLGLGFGAICDPLWDFDCDAYGYPGYGYYGPDAPGLYLDSSSGDDSAAAAASQGYGVYSSQDTGPDNSSAASTSGTTVLYLNDGTSFAVTDYWVADYKLHYLTDGARENVIDLDQVDVQRTVDENAARGVNFTLRPAPGAAQR